MFPTSKPTQRDATSIIWFVGLLYIKKKLFLIFRRFFTTFRCFFFMYGGDESQITIFANILARPRDPMIQYTKKPTVGKKKKYFQSSDPAHTQAMESNIPEYRMLEYGPDRGFRSIFFFHLKLDLGVTFLMSNSAQMMRYRS